MVTRLRAASMTPSLYGGRDQRFCMNCEHTCWGDVTCSKLRALPQAKQV